MHCSTWRAVRVLHCGLIHEDYIKKRTHAPCTYIQEKGTCVEWKRWRKKSVQGMGEECGQCMNYSSAHSLTWTKGGYSSRIDVNLHYAFRYPPTIYIYIRIRFQGPAAACVHEIKKNDHVKFSLCDFMPLHSLCIYGYLNPFRSRIM